MSLRLQYAVMVLVLAIAVMVIAFRPTPDPMDQRNFPCQEDEFLGFVYGVHDKLVCISNDYEGLY